MWGPGGLIDTCLLLVIFEITIMTTYICSLPVTNCRDSVYSDWHAKLQSGNISVTRGDLRLNVAQNYSTFTDYMIYIDND